VAQLLDVALEWAAAGVAVFPCQPLTKKPATPHGFKDATTDPAQIREWWTRWPNANPAAATGAVSNLVVLDPDNGAVGQFTLERLEQELGQLPPTLVVRTPGDPDKGKQPGRHIYLSHPGERVKNRAGERWRPWGKDKDPATGLDVRGDGGYVMLPGSVLLSGTYTIEDKAGEIAGYRGPWIDLLTTGQVPSNGKAPEPLIDMAEPAKDQDNGKPEPLFDKPGRTFTRSQALDYIKTQAYTPLQDAKPGGRNAQLNASAMVCGHFIAGGFGTEAQAVAVLTRIAQEIGLDDGEIGPTSTSGLSAGMAEPYEVTDDDQAKAQKRTQAILDAALDATDLDSLPEPEPLLPGWLNRAEYVLLSGKFGTYKSFVVLAWAYCVATGQGWGGRDAAEPQPVVCVAAEGVAGLRKRLRALERRCGVKIPRGMLTVIRRPIHLANDDEVAGLRMIMKRTGAKLVILDTWHRMTPGIEENSATETGGPLDVALSLRDDYGATVLVAHHTGHTQRHARGSSALEDDADAAWIIALGKGQEEDEDRAAGTVRTLIQRKSKDGELVDPTQLQLLVDDAGEATVEPAVIDLAKTLARAARPRCATRMRSRS
jgi:hypothetical protein